MLLVALIKKAVIYGVIAVAVYQGTSLYTTYTLAEKVLVCGARYGMPQHIEKSEVTRHDFLASAKSWRCVKRDQNFLEALFFKVPDTWINPPRPYVDPPFSPEELADDVVVDEGIRKDLQLLANAYEDEHGRLIKLLDLATGSGGSKLDRQAIDRKYGKVTEGLRLVAARFSEVRLQTRQVNELNGEVVASLRQIASDGQEIGSLLISVNSDLEQSASILAMPKSVISENRENLLQIRDRLTRAEARLQTMLVTLEQDRDNATRAIEALDALARKHGVSLK
jgi:hypothetical protein